MQRLAGMTSLVLAAAAAVACSDSTGPEGQGTVVVQLATLGSGATTAPSLSVSVTRGEDVIVIEDVQLVARKIRLGQEAASCPDDPETEEEEECALIRLGPVLLDPPLAEGVDPEFTVDLPAGSYDELQIQVHKPSNANEDAAFIALNPAFNGVSIRVTGTWNGTPFTFTTDLTQVFQIELEDPLVVEADGETAVTLLLDVGSWFLGQGGTSLINPTGLSQQNRSLVEQNIRQSFHAFEDEDGDGE